MTKVKELLLSVDNRNYIQRDRLLKMKAKVIGKPIMAAFESDANLLDSVRRLLLLDGCVCGSHGCHVAGIY